MDTHAGHRFAAKSIFALVQAIKDAKVNLASQVYLFHLAFSGCGPGFVPLPC